MGVSLEPWMDLMSLMSHEYMIQYQLEHAESLNSPARGATATPC